MGDGTEIIIKGGSSVEVTFNETSYEPVPGDPIKRKNSHRNMTRVRVLDDDGTTVLYDSGDKERVLKYEVRVTTKP
jgi:hypothetical protein